MRPSTLSLTEWRNTVNKTAANILHFTEEFRNSYRRVAPQRLKAKISLWKMHAQMTSVTNEALCGVLVAVPLSQPPPWRKKSSFLYELSCSVMGALIPAWLPLTLLISAVVLRLQRAHFEYILNVWQLTQQKHKRFIVQIWDYSLFLKPSVIQFLTISIALMNSCAIVYILFTQTHTHKYIFLGRHVTGVSQCVKLIITILRSLASLMVRIISDKAVAERDTLTHIQPQCLNSSTHSWMYAHYTPTCWRARTHTTKVAYCWLISIPFNPFLAISAVLYRAC